MRPIRPLTLVALLALGLGTLALGWREGRRHERPDAGRPPAHVVARDSRALIEEAIRLYAAGQFPRACERFSRAADDNPASAALRVDVGSCFEGWGWQALREGRPDEALLLFRQGLVDAPESTTLLKGLGLAPRRHATLRAQVPRRPRDGGAPNDPGPPRGRRRARRPGAPLGAARAADRGPVRARAVPGRDACPRLGHGALRRKDPAADRPGAPARCSGRAVDRPRVRARRHPPPLAGPRAALAPGGAGAGAGGRGGRPDAARAGQRHPGRHRGARRRPRSLARADGLRLGTLDRARPARPRRYGDDARAAGPAGRGRHPRRRDAPCVRAAPGRDRIAVAPPPGRVGLTPTGIKRVTSRRVGLRRGAGVATARVPAPCTCSTSF